MLPGFRFLFAAIFLSMSVLVFGLGAAALLRAAHEEFSSNTSWHGRPETTLAQRGDAARPMLAMLHLGPPAVEKPAVEKPLEPSEEGPAAAAVAPAEPATTAEQPAVSAPTEPDRIAALKPEASPLPEATKEAAKEAAKAEIPDPASPALSESPQPGEAAPADVPAAAGETRIEAAGEAAAPAQETAAAAEAAAAMPEPASTVAATKIATLGGPPVAIEAPPYARPAIARPAIEKPDQSSLRKRQQARRAALRRRIAAAHARLARQALQQQHAANPFFQPPTQPAIR